MLISCVRLSEKNKQPTANSDKVTAGEQRLDTVALVRNSNKIDFIANSGNFPADLPDMLRRGRCEVYETLVLGVCSVVVQFHVIPSAVEGSRRATFEVTSTSSFDSAALRSG